MSQSDADYVKIMLSMSHGTRGVPRKVGPFRVLGKFNSSRTPEKIYTVKEHLDVPADTGKRISCTCPSWRFSFRRLGRYGCKHTMHVLALIDGVVNANEVRGDAAANVEGSIIQKTIRSNNHRGGLKYIVAQAFENADVHVSDVAFRALVYHLRPLLKGRITESVEATERTTIDRDDVLRVITLD
jgi:hypothetical protein